jgi:hypothetical protein
MTSPARPRRTPSGLTRTRVRSMATVLDLLEMGVRATYRDRAVFF